MNSLLTEIGNLVFVIGGIMMVFSAAAWFTRDHLTPDTKNFITAVVMISVAIMLRIGWWVLALRYAPPDLVYHPWFVEHKAWITIPTATLFIAGVVKFLGDVEGFSIFGRVLSVVGAFTIAAIVVLL